MLRTVVHSGCTHGVIEAGKEPEISIRNAKKGVERSVVLTIKDKDGIYLSLIQRIASVTSARIHIKSEVL